MFDIATDEQMARCQELQEEEIATLEAIYPDHCSAEQHDTEDLPFRRVLRLSIPVALARETAVDLVPALGRRVPIQGIPSTSTAGSLSTTALALSYLPPISVQLKLPALYPTHHAPTVGQISCSLPDQTGKTSWLSRRVIDHIAAQLGSLWQEEKLTNGEGAGGNGSGVGIIWRWWEWVANGDFLQELGMLRDDRLCLTIPPSLSSSAFFTLLNRYNAQQIHSSFESTAFACAICFESRKGRKCAQMPCGCVFCHDCLHSCWTLAISEGTLEAVSCPDPACVKKRATKGSGTTDAEQEDVDDALVESVVGREMKDRWVELKARRRAEIDPTYCICPRPGCQAPVPPPAPPSASSSLPSNSSSRTIRLADLSESSRASSTASSPTTPLTPSATDDRWDRYRQCPTCSYSFCLYCSATWHGAHAPCSFPQTSALVLEYLSYPPDSPERARMEQRRGKKNIDRMVAKYLEEEENKKWLDERTRACAGCGVRVEKSHGCNHMTCGRCGAHFCYRCGASIKPMDPYEHYRRPGSSCFEKLFDQEEIARFERETAMQHAGMGHPYGDEWGPRGVWEW